MKTILIIYAIIEVPLLVWWTIAMCMDPPQWNTTNDSRFVKNWKEGGNLIFALSFAISACLTAAAVKVMVWIKLFELL